MYRRYISVFAVLFLIINSTLNLSAQQIPKVSLIGTVTDAESGEPLIGANVYISNSVLGSATNDNGNFIIFNVPYGEHQLIASYIGYEVKKVSININGPAVDPVYFRLKKTETETEEVIVTETAPKNWRYNLERFKEYFLGTSENAKSCEILNPEVLDFYDDGVNFFASANDLVFVENRAMGYRIELLLEQFAVKGKQLFISYVPHFTDLEPENIEILQQWEEQRKRAYYGSLRHFLKSLLNEQEDEEEYAFQSIESLEVNADPTFDLGRREIRITPGKEPYEKVLDFNDFLLVVYYKEGEEREYYRAVDKATHDPMTYDPTRRRAKMSSEQTTYLRLRKDPAVVNTEGILKDPHSVILYGYMGWERLADQLPRDYNPVPEGLDVFPENVRPETRYFASLEQADSAKFHDEYEFPFLLTLEERERRHYGGIETIEGRKGFIRRYIKSRNQNPLYSVNYWFLEFSGRYNSARRQFTIDEPPYIDVRGEFYVKFGKPDQRFTSRGGRVKLNALDQMVEVKTVQEGVSNSSIGPYAMVYRGKRVPDTYSTVRPNESWRYENDEGGFTVHFAKEGRNWKLIEDLTDAVEASGDHAKTWTWMELIKERSHLSFEYFAIEGEILEIEEKISNATIIFDLQHGMEVNIDIPGDLNQEIIPQRPFGNVGNTKYRTEAKEQAARYRSTPNLDERFKDGNALELDYDAAQFRGDEGKTRIELVVRTPIQDILDKRTEPDDSDSISLNYQFIIRDQVFEPVIMSEAARIIPASASVSAGINDIVAHDKAEIEPQTGDLTIMVEDNFNRNRGFKQQLMEIRNFSGDSLMMSDILFLAADDFEVKGILPSRSIDGIEVTPYPYSDLSRARPVFCYFELYNLNTSGFGSVYQVVVSAKQKKSKAGFIKKLFGGSKEINLSITQNRTATGDEAKELISIDMEKLKPGDYTFTIAVVSPNRKDFSIDSTKDITILK